MEPKAPISHRVGWAIFFVLGLISIILGVVASVEWTDIFGLLITLAGVFVASIVAARVRGASVERYYYECLNKIGEDFGSNLRDVIMDISVDSSDANILIPVRKTIQGQDTNWLKIPKSPHHYPWEGRTIKWVEQADFPCWKVDFCELNLNETDTDTVFRGVQFSWLPLAKRRHGKRVKNVFSSETYLKKYEDVRSYLASVFPYELDLIAEKIFSSPVVSGSYPNWLQNPEYAKCTTCKKAMRHIIQIDTYVFDPKRDVRLYVFGCLDHPQSLTTLGQCT